MKKILLMVLVSFSITSTSVQALSWAYPFVVWKGDVYEVTEEEVLEEKIGKKIGEVKRRPNEMTGSYFGDASNAYTEGTKYFEIKGITTKEAIAVEEEGNKWLKAVYAQKAPFHWMNLLADGLPFAILIVLLIIAFWLLRKVRFQKNK
ncbi:hypothetical protein LG296_03500 [Ureibacillus chungkukjangi]|uniref:hypothetical protein n=1 Tax=Ureibacillus chungkukjangi TaxID=1202712 RepID=UPI00384A6C9F